MKELTKKQKKHLRALAEKAYEIDLGRCIDKLFHKYLKWQQQEITVWDLNENIHEYHNEIARGLYKSYTMANPIYSVAFGIMSGVIDISEVDQCCVSDVERVLEALKED
jgi:hypothetical protein